jgi:regulatory protein
MFQRTQKKAAQLLDEKGLRHKFIELLARREYSYGELEQKLLPQALSEEALYSALDWLVEMGLQDDNRFTEMFIRSKALAGYGPVRIRMELRQKHIPSELVELSFENIQDQINWSEEVDRLIEKKANNLDLSDMKSKNKVMNFLQRRGFNLDQIYAGFARLSPDYSD